MTQGPTGGKWPSSACCGLGPHGRAPCAHRGSYNCNSRARARAPHSQWLGARAGINVKRGQALRGAGPQEISSPVLHQGFSPATLAARALNHGPFRAAQRRRGRPEWGTVEGTTWMLPGAARGAQKSNSPNWRKRTEKHGGCFQSSMSHSREQRGPRHCKSESRGVLGHGDAREGSHFHGKNYASTCLNKV